MSPETDALTGAAIHVWLAHQDDFPLATLEAASLDWLDDSERRRCNRLQLARHRQQFLLSRFMVRRVLSNYEPAVAPADWRFVVNDYGKPGVDPTRHGDSLYYNLSHSGGRLALAVARRPLLGVDIEGCVRERRVRRIAARFFSPAEAQALLELRGAARRERFYDLWTLKEAYIKACGLGLAIPLQDFSFALDTPGRIDIAFSARREDEPRAWQFWLLDAGPEHRLALALRDGQGITATGVRLRRFETPGDGLAGAGQDAVIVRASPA